MSDAGMTYKIKEPSAELEPFVECFWLLDSPKKADVMDKGDEVVLPDGKTELIVHFGDDFFKLETVGSKHQYVRQARVLMSGQLTSHIVLRPSGKVGVVAARFKPAGAARFFDIPYNEIVDQVVDFETFEPNLSRELHKEIQSMVTPEARLDHLQNLLITRLRVESQEDLYVRQACRYIMQSVGEYSVSELVKLIGFSERQLERKFKKQVGISPKMLSRIVRFQKFLALSHTTKNLTLADAALSCGYYDQSHFIKDFTKFSGHSPLKYLSTDHAMSDHFTTPLTSRD